MENSCKVVGELNCSVSNILQRITPIQYVDGTLVVSSPMSVGASFGLGGVSLGGADGVLSLPEGTTVGGVPLLSPHDVGGVYALPPKTSIGGFAVLNTHYFNFFTSTTRPFFYVFLNGGYINNYGQNDGTYPGNFPFCAPTDCVLTSLRFSFVVLPVSGGGSPSSTVTNATATIYTVSLSGVQTNTGISAVIPDSPLNSRNYAEAAPFTYPVAKGTSVGIRVQFSGTVSTEVGMTAFAVLGYSQQ